MSTGGRRALGNADASTSASAPTGDGVDVRPRLHSPSTASTKVVVLFKATGDAPILKQNKFKIASGEKFARVIDFLRRQIHRDTVFVYINSSFCPSPDEVVADLYNNFKIDGKLVVNYASTMAWG